MQFEEWWAKTQHIFDKTAAACAWQACDAQMQERITEARAEMREKVVEKLRAMAHEEDKLMSCCDAPDGSRPEEVANYHGGKAVALRLACKEILALPLDADPTWQFQQEPVSSTDLDDPKTWEGLSGELGAEPAQAGGDLNKPLPPQERITEAQAEMRERAASVCDKWADSVGDAVLDQSMAVRQRGIEICALPLDAGPKEEK